MDLNYPQPGFHFLVVFELLPQSQEAATTFGLAAVMNQRYAEAVSPLELAWKRDPANTRLGASTTTSPMAI